MSEEEKTTPATQETEVAATPGQAGAGQDDENIRRLKSTYDRKLAALRKRAEEAERRLQELQAVRMPPDEQAEYIRQHYGRRVAILEAALEHGIPVEELEDVQSPDELKARVDLILRKREVEAEAERKRKELEAKIAEELAKRKAEIEEEIRRQVMAEMGLEQTVSATGSTPKKRPKAQERLEQLKQEAARRRRSTLYEGLREWLTAPKEE